MAMSWPEFLSNLLETTRKVDKAAVFNIKGQPVATTEDLQVTDLDGRALLSCLHDPARSLTKITLDGTEFRCIQGNDNAVVGKALTKVDRVLVARMTEEALIVVLGSSAGHGSFLFEVQQNLQERSRRQMAPQGPVNNGVGAGGGGGGPGENGGSCAVNLGFVAGDGGEDGGSQRRVIHPPSSVVSQEQVTVQLPD